MGSPQAFTEAERRTLKAQGYRPVEVWVSATDVGTYWRQVEDECRQIVASEEAADVNLFVEATTADVFRLIDEEEVAAREAR